MIEILIIILIVTIFIFLMTQHKIEEPFNEDGYKLFTANPLYSTCSKCLDSMPKFARMSYAGAIMYVSNKPPLESNNCYPVKCHPFDDEDHCCFKCH
jgi:hypothetical protein